MLITIIITSFRWKYTLCGLGTIKIDTRNSKTHNKSRELVSNGKAIRTNHYSWMVMMVCDGCCSEDVTLYFVCDAKLFSLYDFGVVNFVLVMVLLNKSISLIKLGTE